MPHVQTEQAEIYYEATGAGPAVVFAHGAGGNRLSWWQQTPHFEADHRVVRIDHRTFGRSTCAPEHFHPKHFPADLLAVLDAKASSRPRSCVSRWVAGRGCRPRSPTRTA